MYGFIYKTLLGLFYIEEKGEKIAKIVSISNHYPPELLSIPKFH